MIKTFTILTTQTYKLSASLHETGETCYSSLVMVFVTFLRVNILYFLITMLPTLSHEMPLIMNIANFDHA